MDNETKMLDEILTIAGELSKAAADEADVLEMLCTASCAEVEGRLRDGIAKEDCEGAFICAAAWLAAAALQSVRAGGDELSSLRAGDLSVSMKSQAERGAQYERLRKQAWDLMAPYIKDSGFCFFGVRG